MKQNLSAIISRTCNVAAPQRVKGFDAVMSRYLRYLQVPSVDLEMIESYKHLFDIPTFLGVEVEVENIHKELSLPAFWGQKQDQSLRNGGMEFYTVPLLPDESMKAVALLWTLFKQLSDKKPDFSWRTSEHVHLNVLDLTEDELKTLLLLCVFFEPLFFQLAGKDREQSVFCVPIMQSECIDSIGNYYRGKTTLVDMSSRWPKYTSINLGRLIEKPHEPALGTVEFRHLGGTPNVKDLIEWEALIVSLYRAAVSLPTDGLKDRFYGITSAMKYHDFISEIFSPDVARRVKIKDAKGLFAGSLSRMKAVFLPYPKYVPVKEDSALVAHTTKVVEKYEKEKRATTAKKLEKVAVDIEAHPHATLQSQQQNPNIWDAALSNTEWTIATSSNSNEGM